MTNWQQILRENDPGLGRMDAEIAARMRERVVRAADGHPSLPALWPMRVALAAFACLVLTMTILGTRHPVATVPEVVPPVAGAERRQIQFATPGGTRIIWELNPNFTLTETLP